MDTKEILTAVKAEISRLQKVVNILEGTTTSSPKAATTTTTPRKRPRLSAAARKKISQAQKARWAAYKAKKKG
jgi:hypothetical protein